MPAAETIVQARTALGIELGSTRIKACLTGPDHEVLAVGSSTWENRFEDRLWTYQLEEVWTGIRSAVAELLDDAEARHGVRPAELGALGVSAMMHGYLAFDDADELLVPFRTWRNTNTGRAAAELTELLGQNIPLRWSAAHYRQAMLDGEEHVPRVRFLTTLAGYVHFRLTGERVLGVGDASGMFPIDPETGTYDQQMLEAFDARAGEGGPGIPLARLLPEVRTAGEAAGRLTPEGAELLDPSGSIRPGAPACPPEGDAGTGMVATDAVAPRTGSVSAGTSIFAMVVLEQALTRVHHEIDLVSTPDGAPVAMVHCNNGASELGAWAGLLREFAAALGHPAEPGDIYQALLGGALEAEPDGGGILAYNTLAGEPIAGLEEGRPMVVRSPGSRLTLGGFARAQLYSIFGTLTLGMRILAEEGVGLDRMVAQGGLFSTRSADGSPGPAQRLLAAAVDAPVAVGETAAEGGAWGMAVLAGYLRDGAPEPLGDYLHSRVFASAGTQLAEPDPADVAGYARWLEDYSAGLTIQRTAAEAIR